MLLAVATEPGALRAQDSVAARADFRPAAVALTEFIADQMAEKGVRALSIALVNDQTVVWARGFGRADSAGGTPATAQTPYRVASVSKLFTDIAIMQLVEAGRVALDTPVTRYLPAFHPGDPFGAPITLRELLSHRSGLVREPPVGNYFDPTSPTLAATALSLDSTTLVYRPGSRTKYSNAAVTVAGYVVERVTGEPFAEHLRRAVLEPLGMTRSSFDAPADLVRERARGEMWTTDGRTFPAPTFPLGISPACELTTTMLDLGRFLSALFAGGRGVHGRIVADSTLAAMWGVQFGAAGQRTGYGLGFAVSTLDGHERIGHSGWHYGFATELAALPRERLGVAVSMTLDAADAVTERIADVALRLMLAAAAGHPLPPIETTNPLAPARARRLAGRWRGERVAVDIEDREGVAWMQPVTGGFPAPLRSRGDTLVADGRLVYGTRLVPARDAAGRTVLLTDSGTLHRIPDSEPPPPPPAWLDLIGEYGWDHDVLFVLEREGRLYAQIEWFALYPLVEIAPDRYRFPDFGLYAGEEVRFLRGEAGAPEAVTVAGVRFPRRAVGTAAGATFRITPLRPVEELRRSALAMRPPDQPSALRTPDLVDLTTVDPRIRLDIRYATPDNFLGTRVYTSARAFLQRPAAEALGRAARWLAARGYGLLIHDAYRPWYVTRMFWDATPGSLRVFVANPATGSNHNRGTAVDLTLYDLRTGRPVQMVGGYDEFSPRSYADYPGGTGLQRWHRRLLRRAMEREGFTVYRAEWWHFDWKDWRLYPVLNVRFEALE
jgi:CubicO group peptidase (beta-lactamase class C family)/D-alanyl-D-alanine dipeptidase